MPMFIQKWLLQVALCGAVIKMYFIAYGIPLIAILAVLATDTSSQEGLPKL